MKRELKEHGNYYEIVENGKVVYCKWNNGLSSESTYDENGNKLSYKNSDGYSYEYTYDKNGNELSYKDSDGCSSEHTYDKNGNKLSYKNSDGNSYESTYDENGHILTEIVNGKLIIDNRKTELTMQDIADKFNIDIDKLKIKK